MAADDENSQERADFLREIQLMKSVGFHSNIVNLLGCCTVCDPILLVVEYVPYGDLLKYLRKRRSQVGNTATEILMIICIYVILTYLAYFSSLFYVDPTFT